MCYNSNVLYTFLINNLILQFTNYIYFSNNVITDDDSNALIDIYTS